MKLSISSLAAVSAIPLAASIALPSHPSTLSKRSPSSANRIPIAPYSVPLTNKVARTQAKQDALRRYRSRWSTTEPSTDATTDEYPPGDSVVLFGPDGGQEYGANITIGGQEFAVIVDTGSSDLWVPGFNYTCISLQGDPETEAECSFGPGVYDPSLSATYQPFDGDANFNITYGDGEFLTGVPAYETVTVGNLTVPSQLFSVVDLAAWNGDNTTAGLLGLASPYITSVFNGSDPTEDDYTTNAYVYNPFFYTAVADNLTESFFSIALNRPTFAEEESADDLTPFGYLSFGGIPAEVNVTDKAVTVPDLSFLSLIDGVNYTEPLFYTVAVDEWTFKGSEYIVNGTNDTSTILDSGTTLLYLRDDIADAINKKFDPPAVYNKDADAWIVDCNATAPDLAVTIGGTSFSFEATDLIFFGGEQGETSNEAVCISSVLKGGPAGSVFILGDRFLVNVVATFDIVSYNITLSERQY